MRAEQVGRTVRIQKTLLAITLLWVIAAVSLSAATVTHIIDSYNFDVLGKSHDFMLKRFIVPPEGDPPFASLEQMLEALDEKQQILFNKRLFEKVSYTYEVIRKNEKSLYYRVTFHVDDAFTLLPIPYPKYDSNYGFMFGLKVYEKNLLGLFGDLFSEVKATQRGSSWEDWDLYSKMTLSDFPIGTSMLNLKGEYEGIYEDGIFNPDSYSVGLDWKKISLGSSTLFMNGELGADFSEEDADLYAATGEFEWTDINVFGSTLNLAGWFEGEKDTQGEYRQVDYLYTGSWIIGDPEREAATLHASYDSDHDLVTSLEFSEITFYDTSVTFEPILKQYVDDTSWNLTDAQLHITYEPFYLNGEAYQVEFLNTLPIGKAVIETSNTLHLLDAQLFDAPFEFYVNYGNAVDLIEWELFNNHYEVGISSKMSLPWSTTYEYSYSGEFNAQSEDPLNLIPIANTSQELSFGEVNWKNNFRSGMEGSFSFNGTYIHDKGIENRSNRLSFVASGTLETYFTLGRHLGVSSRLTGMISHYPDWSWDYLEIDTEDQHYPEYLPDDPTYIPDNIRGILNTEIEELIGDGDYRKLGAVMNLDITLMFIKFDGFAEGFISAFSDVGVFTPSQDTVVDDSFDSSSLVVLKTVGIEGYGILDKFRSYPVRMSLGVDYDDLVDHFQGNRDFSDIGYELTLGMGLFY